MCVTPVAAFDDTPAASCPGYVEHLRNARTYLGQGDRKAAANELRRARNAIDGCVRDKAGEGNTVAAG